MEAKFDIFLRLPDGEPLWVTVVEGLETAKRELHRRRLDIPGEYFLFNARTGEVLRTPD